MPEPNFDTVGRKLLWRGFSAEYAQRATRELREHWEDLRDEWLKAGHSLPEAEARANDALGDVQDLPHELAARMRSNSWVGRHRIFGFFLLPLVGLIVWWTLFLYSMGWSSGALAWSHDSTLSQPDWEVLQRSLKWCQWSAAVVLPVGFAWLARRTGSGLGWGLLAAALFALHNGMHFARITPPGGSDPGFMMGYTIRLNWFELNYAGFALPLLAFIIFIYGGLKLQFRKIGQTL